MRDRERVRFWMEYRTERRMNEADGFRAYIEADCASPTYAASEMADLFGDRVVANGGSESGLTAEPGSNMAIALANVCAGRFLSGRVEPIAHAREQFGR